VKTVVGSWRSWTHEQRHQRIMQVKWGIAVNFESNSLKSHAWLQLHAWMKRCQKQRRVCDFIRRRNQSTLTKVLHGWTNTTADQRQLVDGFMLFWRMSMPKQTTFEAWKEVAKERSMLRKKLCAWRLVTQEGEKENQQTNRVQYDGAGGAGSLLQVQQRREAAGTQQDRGEEWRSFLVVTR
jgi:hypothetical protein